MRAAAPAAALLVVLVLALAAPAAAGTPEALDRAVEAVGGEDALEQLDGVAYDAEGQAWIFNEGFTPGGPPTSAATFTARVQQRVAGRDAFRLELQRNSRGTPRPVTEVVDGRRGTITGQYANFGPPLDAAPMTADRVAALVREQRLLHPHLLLREALARGEGARGDGHVLTLRDDVAPIRLHVEGGEVTRLVTQEHDPMRRTVDVEVAYGGWQDVGDGLRMPSEVAMTVDGFLMYRETRTGMAADPAVAPGTFDAGDQPPGDRLLAARGERTSRWLQAFAQLGFPKDGPYDLINPRVLGPGVVLLDGVSNSTLVIERAGGIVVVEGSVHDLRSEQVLAYIAGAFPGKPITHAVSLHHHADHNGGLRPYVARGARAIVHETAGAFFTGVFGERGSRILPDRLDFVREPAVVETVGADGVTLPDATRPVAVYPDPSTHAADTVFVHVPDIGLVFVNGDTYGPGGAPGAGGRSLQEQILLRGLSVEQIAGAHGTPVTYASFLEALAAAG